MDALGDSQKTLGGEKMAGITGYGYNSWMFGQQADAFPDKTLSQRKWDAYIAGIESIQEEIRRQVQSEGDRNLQVADGEREERREAWTEEWEKFVVFSKVNMERILKGDEGNGILFDSEGGEEILRKSTEGSVRLKVEPGQQEEDKDLWFPYDCLSQDGVTITYNGITFQCDREQHTISLGDTSRKENTIVIPLSGGGTLLVNKNSIPSLGKAIGMFSPEDIGIILRTVAEYKRITSMKYEMEEEEEQEMENMTEGSSGAEPEEGEEEVGSVKPEDSKTEGSSNQEEESLVEKDAAVRERAVHREDSDRENE